MRATVGTGYNNTTKEFCKTNLKEKLIQTTEIALNAIHAAIG